MCDTDQWNTNNMSSITSQGRIYENIHIVFHTSIPALFCLALLRLYATLLLHMWKKRGHTDRVLIGHIAITIIIIIITMLPSHTQRII